MEISGIYGSKYMKFYPLKNSTYFEKFFVYKNSIKRLGSTTLGCQNYDKEDSIGQCIVKFVEDKYNCTTYQIFANKLREPCDNTKDRKSRSFHRSVSFLSEYGIYNMTRCKPHCEHDEIKVRSMGNPTVKTSKNPTFSLEFQFEDEEYYTREEFILYDADSFIADIGGYLGLLLGHSMLSIYRSFVERLSKSKIHKDMISKLGKCLKLSRIRCQMKDNVLHC